MKAPIGKRRNRASRSDRYFRQGEVNHILNSWLEFNKYRVIAECQACIGLRSCEAVAINLFDFSKDFLSVRVRLAKTDKIITMPIPYPFNIKLKEYCQRNYLSFIEGYIFPSIYNLEGHVSKATYWEEFRQARKRAGVADYIQIDGKKLYRLGTHSLRRLYLTTIHGLYPNPKLIADLIGWTDTRPIMKYIEPYSFEFKSKVINHAVSILFSPGQKQLV